MDEIQVKLSIDNATGNVNLEITDKALKKIVQSVGDVDKATKTMSDNFVSSFQNMRNVGQGAEQAWAALEGIFGNGIKKATEYELSLAKLNGVIRSGGKDNEVSIAGMEKFANAFSKQSMFYKTDVMDVERYLLSFKNITANTEDATKASMGLALALDTNLRGGTIALARGLDQGVEGMRNWSRMGIKLTSDELEHAKALEDEGKTYEYQTYVISLLSKKYQDMNEEIQKTDAFKLNQAQKALGDIEKQAGMLELNAVRPLLTGLGNMFELFSSLPGPIKGSVTMITELTVAYGILNTTGIGATIKNLLAYDFGLQANKVAKLENIIMTTEMTAAEQTQALAAYESAIATKGFWASMGPIGWAIIGITTLATVWGLLSDTVGASSMQMSEEEKKLREQQNEYQRLASIIKDTTKTETDRSFAMKEMGEKFGDLIPLSKLENSTEAEKNTILEHGNDLLVERIKLKSKEKLIQAASDELVKRQSELDAIKKKREEAANTKTSASNNINQNANVIGGLGPSGSIVSINSNADITVKAIEDGEKKVKDAQAEFDRQVGTGKKEKEETSEVRAAELVEKAKTTNGWTGEKIDKLIKELKDIEPKLVIGTALQKQVNQKSKELSDSRYGKTGGNGLGYLAEDTKMDLEAVDKVQDMYTLIDQKWATINQMVMKNGKGAVDTFKTKEQQQKARFKERDALEKGITSLMKDKVKETEANVEASGGDKIEVQEAKLKTMLQIMAEVEKQSVEWNKNHKDFPVISKQKNNEWKIDVIKQQNELAKLKYDAGAKDLNEEEQLISKRMEIENAGDMERLLLKESYLEKEIDLAAEYGQTEKVQELMHQLDMNDLEKKNIAKKMVQRSRDASYDVKISGAERNHDDYSAEKLTEEKKLKDDLDKVKEDTLLNDHQKMVISEEMEKAHQEKINEIKRKYYDAWLGELVGLSMRDIATTQKILQQFEAGANSLMSMQQAKGQEDADNYRKTETDKLDTQKKAALSHAKTQQQKDEIEADFAKRKDKIDDDANKKGQERIKLAFFLQKAAGIASAMINTYTAATAALAPPPVGAGPLLGPILAGVTIAAGLLNVAAISSQEPPKFALGGLPQSILSNIMVGPNGLIHGPGTGTSDSIIARISTDEFIINAAATKKHRMLLEQINANKFSSGGFTGGYSLSNSYSNVYKNDNLEMMNELRGMRNDFYDLISNEQKRPVAIGDRQCRDITSRGIGRMKKGKQ